jgi:dethiobiotin synthetase
LRARGIAILGIVFIGEENVETERIIAHIGRVAHLGRLPHLARLTADTLRASFARHFNIGDFVRQAV